MVLGCFVFQSDTSFVFQSELKPSELELVFQSDSPTVVVPPFLPMWATTFCFWFHALNHSQSIYNTGGAVFPHSFAKACLWCWLGLMPRTDQVFFHEGPRASDRPSQ